MTSLDAGTLLGRFEVIRLRGKGGMGEVYEAHDPELDRAVALKVLPPGRDEAWQRLLREAQALARLAHPNVVSVHDVGVAEGRVFVAMEFVDGETLDVHLAARPRSWRTTLALFVQAARGLVAAHERALVHRDFKPSNVLVDRAGRVRVSDFGHARLALEDEVSGASAPSQDPSFGSRETVDASDPTLDRSPDAGQRLGAQLTGAGAVIGTPRYMAPEQRAGRRAPPRR